MISKILSGKLAKKLAVFVVLFVFIGALSSTTAPSLPLAESIETVPPPDEFYEPVQHCNDFICYYSAAEKESATFFGMPGQEEEARPVFLAMPALVPLHPHVDTLGFFYLEQIPLSYELQRYTYDRSAALGLEYELVLALMWRESTFRIEAVGVNRNGTRDSGLMQINDVNRGWLEERHGIYNLMDPFQNIDAGTMILGDLLSRHEERLALIAYQFGESGMRRVVGDGADINALTRRVREKRDEFRIMRAQVYNDLNAYP